MPEHHDDLDLDRAFADLLEDVGGRTNPPPASTVIQRARRRRTTTFAAAAAVVLIVGAAAVASGVGRPSAAPGPSGQLPAPHVLDRDAWASATDGWIDGWKEPSDSESLAWVDKLQDPNCLSSMPDTGPEPDRTGSLVMASGSHAVVFAALADFDDLTKAQTTWRQLNRAISGCSDATLLHQATWEGAEAVSYGTDNPGSSDYFWFAREGQAMAFVWVAGETTPPPAATDTRVMTALVAGLQAPGSFQGEDSLAGSDSGSASGSGTVPAVPRRSMIDQDFAAALGTWDSGWRKASDKLVDVSLPCLSSDELTGSLGSNGGFGSSLGSNGSYSASWYDDETSAARAVDTVADQLTACSTPYLVDVVGTRPQVLVASSEAGVAWLVRRGTTLGAIEIQGEHTDPPTEVSAAVGAVIDRALRTTTP